MKFTALQIAALLGGAVEGDPNVEVWNVAKIEEGAPGMLSFLANPKYTPYIYETESSVVIVTLSPYALYGRRSHRMVFPGPRTAVWNSGAGAPSTPSQCRAAEETAGPAGEGRLLPYPGLRRL